jgi:hypothetical protein
MRIKPDLAKECGFGITDFLCRAPGIDPQQKRDQALNDGGVGAGMEGDLAIVRFGREMHDRLASAKPVFVTGILCRQGRQAPSEIDQQLVPVLPVIQKPEFVDDLAGGVCGTVHDGCILSI